MASNDPQNVRSELVQLLLRKVDADTYPSVTMMNLVEEMLTPEEAAEYARILMQKITTDTYPSMDLIDRARAMADVAAAPSPDQDEES